MVYNDEMADSTAAAQRTVIIAIDDSEFSMYAFDFYVEHIHREKDNIVLVHVPEFHSIVQAPALLTDPNVVSELIKEEEAGIKKLINKFSDKMKAAKLGGKVKQMVGKVGEAIIEASKEEHADFIVVGTRGMGTIRRTFLGSISDYCLHHSNVPVFVCCHRDHHQKHHHH
ncbi:hypothetical protein KUTeg_010030 [Tegillarca granosa]|uniref:UspA domain-containing protein n=1 Tax=Tegillarca granosa TaxID=220873 RepID=A0ABQ9F9Y2_TEGGR|nr:hypothetical protein KUTeg_010030 [Tegillarca granosa]